MWVLTQEWSIPWSPLALPTSRWNSTRTLRRPKSPVRNVWVGIDRGMLCYVMLCYVMLCYVMLCYVMLCYVMLCYVMLCYVMLCYVMYIDDQGDQWQMISYCQRTKNAMELNMPSLLSPLNPGKVGPTGKNVSY